MWRPVGEGDGDAQYSELKSTDKFRPAKGFAGAESGRGVERDKPVQFEKEARSDPFGVEEILEKKR